MQTLNKRCCIVGGGPAGMMLGLLLARAGVEVAILEKHGDFLRDFRGDTVHPSTLEVLTELGLKASFDQLPQHRVEQLDGLFADGMHALGDFRKLKPYPYLALVPQWDLLNLLAAAAKNYPGFSLHMECEATDIVRDEYSGCITGVMATTPQGRLHVRADLTIGCDGRHSLTRQAAGLIPENLGAPMDVLWFRLPREPDESAGTFGVPGRGNFLVMLNRNEYWQTACVIEKGEAARWRAQPIETFRARLAQQLHFMPAQVDSLASWNDVKLLEVRVDRLRQWHCPGLLLIGDAAHAMSPIGGVGINLAIQDAVATANILSPALLREGRPDSALLAAVQRRRQLPTRVIQAVQVFLQRRLIAPALAKPGNERPIRLPAAARALLRFDFIRAIPARLFGLGVRREHVRSPQVERLTPKDRR